MTQIEKYEKTHKMQYTYSDRNSILYEVSNLKKALSVVPFYQESQCVLVHNLGLTANSPPPESKRPKGN